MTRYTDTFSACHVILPVIHVAGAEQALRNAAIAREAGTDGVFLINHNLSAEELLAIHQAVKAEHPDWWVGVNCLDLRPAEVFLRINDSVSGVWADNAMIDERSVEQPAARDVLRLIDLKKYTGLYFGGVAFKYQRSVEDLATAAVKAAKFMDVVTTSGPGTGQAADLEKVLAMKRALGPHPLAIASGITPENVHSYLTMADCFLVATGISQSFHEFDPARLRALVQAVRF